MSDFPGGRRLLVELRLESEVLVCVLLFHLTLQSLHLFALFKLLPLDAPLGDGLTILWASAKALFEHVVRDHDRTSNLNSRVYNRLLILPVRESTA